MPEFILDHGDSDHAKLFRTLDAFTQGYIEAAFFTSTGDGDDAENDLEYATTAEIAPTALAAVAADCARWQGANTDLLQRAYDMGEGQGHYDAHRAGNDYWYTRNGHGTGFWDRDLGETGDMLANACRYHTVNMVRGDDGLIHFE